MALASLLAAVCAQTYVLPQTCTAPSATITPARYSSVTVGRFVGDYQPVDAAGGFRCGVTLFSGAATAVLSLTVVAFTTTGADSIRIYDGDGVAATVLANVTAATVSATGLPTCVLKGDLAAPGCGAPLPSRPPSNPLDCVCLDRCT